MKNNHFAPVLLAAALSAPMAYASSKGAPHVSGVSAAHPSSQAAIKSRRRGDTSAIINRFTALAGRYCTRKLRGLLPETNSRPKPLTAAL